LNLGLHPVANITFQAAAAGVIATASARLSVGRAERSNDSATLLPSATVSFGDLGMCTCRAARWQGQHASCCDVSAAVESRAIIRVLSQPLCRCQRPLRRAEARHEHGANETRRPRYAQSHTKFRSFSRDFMSLTSGVQYLHCGSMIDRQIKSDAGREQPGAFAADGKNHISALVPPCRWAGRVGGSTNNRNGALSITR
jgi:hypothetical protein